MLGVSQWPLWVRSLQSTLDCVSDRTRSSVKSALRISVLNSTVAEESIPVGELCPDKLLIGVVGNLAGLPETYDAVRQVTSMANIPVGVGPPWRTSSPIVIIPGVISIVLGKFAAVLCGAGGILMLKNIRASADDFLRSKKLAVAGAGLAFALTFFSFTVIAESAVFSFYGPEGGVGALAFRYEVEGPPSPGSPSHSRDCYLTP